MNLSDYLATKAVEKAYKETKRILIDEFNYKFWLKLSLIVFLATFSLGGMQNNFSMDEDDDFPFKDFDIQNTAILFPLLSVIFFLLFLSLFIKYLGAVFEFVFISAILSRDFHIKNWFKENMKNGLSLFIFRIAFGFFTLFLILAIVGIVVFVGIQSKSVPLAILMGIPTLMFLGIYIVISMLVGTFTNDFVVPIMYSEKGGIIQSWKDLLNSIKSHLSDFSVYIVLKIGIGLLTGIIGGLISLTVFLISMFFIGIIGLGIGIGLWAMIKTYSSMKLVVIPLVIIGVILWIISMMIISLLSTILTLPIPVFFRFYSIFFIQDIIPKITIVQAKKARMLKPEKPDMDYEEEQISSDEVKIF